MTDQPAPQPPADGDDDVLASLASELAEDAGVSEALGDLDAAEAAGTAVEPGPTLEERAAADPRTREELYAALEEAEQRAGDVERTAEDYLEALQRRQAEFDNFRKRNQRVAAEQRSAGVGDLAAALLDVADDLDGAAAAAADEDSALATGVVQLRQKLLDVLAARGVERIDETDVPFDPTRHEAVQSVPRGEDDPPGETVQAVFRPGYVLGDRVLRAAMVVVRQ